MNDKEKIKELKHIAGWQGTMLKKFGDELRYFQRQKGNILYEKKMKKYRDEIIELKKEKKRTVNETDLLTKDNHSLGCNLEGYADVLRFRGYDREAEKLDEIASRIK